MWEVPLVIFITFISLRHVEDPNLPPSRYSGCDSCMLVSCGLCCGLLDLGVMLVSCRLSCGTAHCDFFLFAFFLPPLLDSMIIFCSFLVLPTREGGELPSTFDTVHCYYARSSTTQAAATKAVSRHIPAPALASTCAQPRVCARATHLVYLRFSCDFLLTLGQIMTQHTTCACTQLARAHNLRVLYLRAVHLSPFCTRSHLIPYS